MNESLLNAAKFVGRHLQEGGLVVIAVFAPMKQVFAVALTLVIADFITGVIASKKTGVPITSAGFKRTIGKVLLYQAALCVTFIVEKYLTGDLFPAAKLVGALIGLVESKSILENLDKINGSPMFNKILERIVQTRDDLGKK